MTKEIPILFSTPMVQAILDGRKTMTRRIVKDQPIVDRDAGMTFYYKHKVAFDIHDWKNEIIAYSKFTGKNTVLYVKETFYAWGHWTTITENGKSKKVFKDLTIDNNKTHLYAATSRPVHICKFGELGWHKRPSLFMPQNISRIRLSVENVRIEQLKNISVRDCEAEGIDKLAQSLQQILMDGVLFRDYSKPIELMNDGLRAKDSFKSLWQSINGPDSWEANPWVWVVEFKRIEKK